MLVPNLSRCQVSRIIPRAPCRINVQRMRHGSQAIFVTTNYNGCETKMLVNQAPVHVSVILVVILPIALAPSQVRTYKAVLRCSQGSPPQEIKYHFTAACKQSKMKAIATMSVSTVQECKLLANKKHAFAINFAHKALLHPAVLNFTKDTCVLYECPELGIRLSEQANDIYDYYSSYARSPPKTNVSCIPKVGLFQLHRERKSFESAEKACDDEGGTLADITTDLLTTHLSSLIASLNVSVAYVGLKQWNESQDEYLTSKRMPLSCLKFRSWAPNEPRPIPQNKCVYLTSKGYWKVKDCDKKLPFLCELKQQGPMQPCRRIRNPRRKKRCLKTYLSSLPRKNRSPKCGDPVRRVQEDRREARRRRRKQREKENSTTTAPSHRE